MNLLRIQLAGLEAGAAARISSAYELLISRLCTNIIRFDKITTFYNVFRVNAV